MASDGSKAFTNHAESSVDMETKGYDGVMHVVIARPDNGQKDTAQRQRPSVCRIASLPLATRGVGVETSHYIRAMIRSLECMLDTKDYSSNYLLPTTTTRTTMRWRGSARGARLVGISVASGQPFIWLSLENARRVSG